MSKKAKPAPKLLAAKITYHYYITYAHENGFGCMTVTLDYPINNWERINIVIENIKSRHRIKGDLILTYWILL